MKGLFLCIGVVLFAFSACKKQETTVITNQVSGAEATIAWQECADFTDHGITICFVGANEYRCPCNSECIWESAVDATLHITTSTGIDTTLTLTTNSSPEYLHSWDTIAGKIIRFVNTTTTTPYDDCEGEYGDYEKYKAIITVE